MKVNESTCIVATGVWITTILVLCSAAFVLASKPDYVLLALAFLINANCMILSSPVIYRMVTVKREPEPNDDPW